MGEGNCPKGMFECNTSWSLRTCLSERWKCDGKEECIDGLDEANCTHCNADLWECRAKNPPFIKCLDRSWRCDGHRDCDFGEDEADCKYTTRTGSDETSVTNVKVLTENDIESVVHVHGVLKSPYFVYGLSSTVFILLVVLIAVCFFRNRRKTRRRRTLPTISSESKRFLRDIGDCTGGRFKCKTKNHRSICISPTWVCDWREHCSDGVDEHNCTSCNAALFECKASDPSKRECLDKSWLCDGNRDCEFGDDEVGCNYTTKHKEPRTGSSKVEVDLASNQTSSSSSTTIAPTPSYDRSNVDFRRSQSNRTDDIVTGSNGTTVQVEAKDEFESIVQDIFKSTYFVYGLLSTVFVLVVILVIVCVFRGRRKKRRRRTLPPIPQQERRKLISEHSSGTTVTSSSTKGSSPATTVDSLESHEYEDIEKYRCSAVLIAQTSSQPWNTGCPENNFDDNKYLEITDCTDNESRRNSSYAAVMQFNNGHPSALLSFYEQPLKCQDQPQLQNEYLSLQEGPITENFHSQYEETVSKKSDNKSKSKNVGFDEDRANNLDSKSGFQTEHHLIQQVPIESVSTGCEESVMKVSYKHNKNNIKGTRGIDANVSKPLAVHSERCSIEMESAQQGQYNDDYLRPINDDYIHPV